MGQYLLCGVIAEHPYFVDELDLRIFTAEELCYFIYHNLSFIEDDFISERLKKFIREDIKLPELADKISRYYQTVSDMDGILVLILRDIGYYDDKEILKFQEQLAYIRKQNPLERIRDKADSLFQKRKYRGAIKIYQNILKTPRDLRLGSPFYAGVMQHMAVVYMRGFLYEEALLCYEAAYQEGPTEQILEQWYYACMMAGRELPEMMMDEPEEVVEQWHCRWLAKENETAMKVESGEVTHLFSLDAVKRAEELKIYMEKKKKEYRKMASSI